MSMELVKNEPGLRPCIFFDTEEEAAEAFALIQAVLGPRDPEAWEGPFEGQAESLDDVMEEVSENRAISRFFEVDHPANYGALHHAKLLVNRLVIARLAILVQQSAPEVP